MRARNIKPGFFRNEELVELDPCCRLLFIGLWCMADREGRLEDRPRKIKLEVLPYDDVDPDRLLQDLHDSGLIRRYSVNGSGYILVPNFLKHQRPHTNEKASEIPPPSERDERGEGQGAKEGKPKKQGLPTKEESTCDQGDKSGEPGGQALRSDSLNPDSLKDIPPPTPPSGGESVEGSLMDEDKIWGQLACYLLQKIRANKEDFRPNFGKRDLTKWAKTMRLIIEKDKREPDVIQDVIDFAQSDNVPGEDGFCWAHVVLSPGSLCKKFDQLEMRMKAGRGGGNFFAHLREKDDKYSHLYKRDELPGEEEIDPDDKYRYLEEE